MFSLYARLAVAAAIALALAAGFWKAYHSGYKAREAIAQVEEAQRTAQALEASEAARKVEQELTAKVGKVDRAYQEQKRATAHVAAAAADGLRNLEAILTAPATASSGAVASSGVDDPRDGIIAECAGNAVKMDAIARRLQDKTNALQDYAAGVCMSKD
jgi:Flp pilus assembly protein TadB